MDFERSALPVASSTPSQVPHAKRRTAEDRHGLIVEADATKATSRAEREAALAMIERHDPGSERRLTLGADKNYDTRGFVAECRRLCVTPHVAAKIKHSAIDRRTMRHAAYATSQQKRKLIEEAFGWAKTIAGLAKVKVRGLARVRHCFTLAMTAYNAQAASDGPQPNDRGRHQRGGATDPSDAKLDQPQATTAMHTAISAAC